MCFYNLQGFTLFGFVVGICVATDLETYCTVYASLHMIKLE